MFQDEVRFLFTATIDYDPGADEVIPIGVAPKDLKLREAYVTVVNDVAASTADYFRVRLVKISSGVQTPLTDWAGGTAGWTGLSPVQFTIVESSVGQGDVLAVEYDETGAATFTQMAVQANVTYGN